MTADDDGTRVLTVCSCAADWRVSSSIAQVPLLATGTIRLGRDVDGAVLRFRHATDDD